MTTKSKATLTLLSSKFRWKDAFDLNKKLGYVKKKKKKLGYVIYVIHLTSIHFAAINTENIGPDRSKNIPEGSRIRALSPPL